MVAGGAPRARCQHALHPQQRGLRTAVPGRRARMYLYEARRRSGVPALPHWFRADCPAARSEPGPFPFLCLPTTRALPYSVPCPCACVWATLFCFRGSPVPSPALPHQSFIRHCPSFASRPSLHISPGVSRHFSKRVLSFLQACLVISPSVSCRFFEIRALKFRNPNSFFFPWDCGRGQDGNLLSQE